MNSTWMIDSSHIQGNGTFIDGVTTWKFIGDSVYVHGATDMVRAYSFSSDCTILNIGGYDREIISSSPTNIIIKAVSDLHYLHKL